MKHRIPLLIVLLVSAAASTGSWAGDAQAGKELVHENCVSCHGDEIYTRSDRKVDSPAALKKQVQRCEQALGLTWFDDQIGDTATYLNDNYYKFK